MEKKQNSIEWLVQELNHNIEFIPLAHWDKIRDIVQQAKQLHEQEIIDAYEKGYGDGYIDDVKTGEQYYKDNYGEKQ